MTTNKSLDIGTTPTVETNAPTMATIKAQFDQLLEGLTTVIANLAIENQQLKEQVSTLQQTLDTSIEIRQSEIERLRLALWERTVERDTLQSQLNGELEGDGLPPEYDDDDWDEEEIKF